MLVYNGYCIHKHLATFIFHGILIEPGSLDTYCKQYNRRSEKKTRSKTYGPLAALQAHGRGCIQRHNFVVGHLHS